MKNIVKTINENKGVILKKGLIILGAAAGLVLAIATVKSVKDHSDDKYVDSSDESEPIDIGEEDSSEAE